MTISCGWVCSILWLYIIAASIIILWWDILTLVHVTMCKQAIGYKVFEISYGKSIQISRNEILLSST